MPSIRNAPALLVLMSALSFIAWGQGGRGRGAQTQQQGTPTQQAAPPAATPAPQAGRGGRGGAPGPATSEFYNYDPNAGSAPAISDSQPTETHQKVTINGQAVNYTARAGYLPLRNATTGQSEAHLFYTAYSKDGGDSAVRPVCFFLGGGPGVAASWQEFGGLGPKRMKWAADGGPGMPPYGWAENPNTLLAQADLVFVNPVGTAYSRPDQPGRGPSFWTSASDVASLGEFVRSYLNAYNLRNSPLFLAGEDAGTGRAAGLAAYLIEHQIPVQGVALLSMSLSPDAMAGDAQYINLLPSLTMAAWRHKKLAQDLNAMSAEQIAGQARQFAAREYLHALYKGDRMTAEERTKVIADLSRFTGLSKAFIVNNNLRITLDRFNTELLHDQHKGLSTTDARVTGFLPTAGAGGRGGGGGGGFFGAPPVVIDFNLSSLAGGFQAAYEGYLKRELSFGGNNTGIYYLTGGGIGTFTSAGNDDASLAGAFARNPNLRLYVAMNYYDLGAPFYATEFTLAHLNVSPEVRAHNITISHFESGQMPYVDNHALAKLQSDLAGFVKQATSSERN